MSFEMWGALSPLGAKPPPSEGCQETNDRAETAKGDANDDQPVAKRSMSQAELESSLYKHIMLVIRFIITCAIPDIPGWLATEMAKIEWARRNASRAGNTATPSPEEVEAKTIGRFSVSPSHSLVHSDQLHEYEEKIDVTLSNQSPDINESLRNVPISHVSPIPSPTTPSTSHSSITSSHKTLLGITPESIQPIPPFRPRKSKDWVPPETAAADIGHHLTIGPSGAIEWTKKLKEENDIHKSTDCISPKDASSSDTELHKTSPMWPPKPRSPPEHSGPRIRAPIIPIDPSLSDSAKSISSQEADEAAKAAEEFAAKKTRVKQSLMKRARSVAIFSLKLKERRAREAQEKTTKPTATPSTPLPPPQCGGGELSCIPIEMLIQLEDVRKNAQTKTSNQQGL
ncbi:hypothetical protein ABEB36_003645 [Hypothenemus hampei]|uniref:Uncharacterized protein n=1 Tax=Hypothenemus hampei TaxID=57062 RepID=A0ABD1FAC1_HYPHA